MTTIVVVAHPGDCLADAVISHFQSTATPVVKLEPAVLADQVVELQADTFILNDQVIGGILFRCIPNEFFSENFATEEQHFANTELQALWLAAIHLNSVCSVNRLDPVAWFSDSNWMIWYERLMNANIPVAPFVFGSIPPKRSSGSFFWQPHRAVNVRPAPEPIMQRVIGATLTSSLPAQRYLFIGNKVLTDQVPTVVATTQRFLIEKGVILAEIILDQDERVLSINTLPLVNSPAKVATLLVEIFHDHLYIC